MTGYFKIFIIFQLLIISEISSVLIYKDFSYKTKKEIIEVTINLRNVPQGISVNVTGILKQDLDSPLIRIVLGLRNPVNPKHYINQSNKTISACNFNESSKKNMMVKTFLDGLKDFQLRCPYKKGPISISNWMLKDTYIPGFMKGGAKFRKQMTFLSKYQGHQQISEILSYQLIGEV